MLGARKCPGPSLQLLRPRHRLHLKRGELGLHILAGCWVVLPEPGYLRPHLGRVPGEDFGLAGVIVLDIGPDPDYGQPDLPPVPFRIP